MLLRIIKIAALFFLFVIVFGASAYLTLKLIIKSEDTVVVPILVKKDVVYVLEILTNIGLNAKVGGSEYSSAIPKNHVISQEPDPGTEIKKGRDVRIIISKGAKAILTPNIKGLPVQQAGIIIEENDLHQGELSRTYSSSIKKNEIIAQFPSPGVMIRRGLRIDLLMSMGRRPKSYKMPELTGLSLDEAILLIESANLLLGEVKSSFKKNKPQNVIISQEPFSGYRVMDGSIVNLAINRKPGRKGHGLLQDSTGVSLFRYRIDNGFLKKHIRVQVNMFGTSIDLFNEFMKPGGNICLLIPQNKEAIVFLYEDGKLIKKQTFDPWNSNP